MTDDREVQRQEEQRRERRQQIGLPDAPAVGHGQRIDREQEARDHTGHRAKRPPAQDHGHADADGADDRHAAGDKRRIARHGDHRREEINEVGGRAQADRRQRAAQRDPALAHDVFGEMDQDRFICAERREVEMPDAQTDGQQQDADKCRTEANCIPCQSREGSPIHRAR